MKAIQFIFGALLLAGASSAGAQTLNVWANKSGDLAAATPAVIEVLANSTVTLSVYGQSAGLGNLIGMDVMFGYDKTSTQGSGAEPDVNLVTFNSLSWAGAFAGGDIQTQQGGGFGATGFRPYGAFTSATALTGNFGSLDSVATKLFNITLNLGALSFGDTRAVTLFSAPGATTFSTAALSESQGIKAPTSYTTTLKVVPEPASMAALGLGIAVLARRKRGVNS